MIFLKNLNKTWKVIPWYINKTGRTGKRYFGDKTGPVITKKYSKYSSDKKKKFLFILYKLIEPIINDNREKIELRDAILSISKYL